MALPEQLDIFDIDSDKNKFGFHVYHNKVVKEDSSDYEKALNIWRTIIKTVLNVSLVKWDLFFRTDRYEILKLKRL